MDAELTPELILEAYSRGIFPMADADGEIAWFSPDPRCIFPLDEFHVPRSTRQAVERGGFEIRIDTSFREVMLGCAAREDGTWISEEILEVYCALHDLGCAHSVEAWRDGQLAGGLYGVALGGAFFGESMFHRATNASKVALVALVERMKSRGFVLLDTQWITPHLAMFGATDIPREQYLHLLRGALLLTPRFAD